MAPSGGEVAVKNDNGGRRKFEEKRSFLKDNTVIVDVKDNSAVKASRLITEISELCGEEALLACVPKSGNLYEVTLDGRAPTNILIGGITIDGNVYDCREAEQKFVLVSFLHLAAYISDDEIISKMRELHVELVSPIKRRYYPGTKIADGTRYVKVKLPPKLTSLPYSMKFGSDYYRVIHDNQTKVCSLCYSDEHMFKACPQFVCYKCGRQGHYARTCRTPPCNRCGFRTGCECTDEPRSQVMSLCEECGQFGCACNGEQVNRCIDCDKINCVCAAEREEDVSKQEVSGTRDDNYVEMTESTSVTNGVTLEDGMDGTDDDDDDDDDDISIESDNSVLREGCSGGRLWENGDDWEEEKSECDDKLDTAREFFKYKVNPRNVHKRRSKRNKGSDIKKLKKAVEEIKSAC